MDVYPTERKRTDIPAYCPSSPETGAFVLANFREDLRTAFFLAHELGHAMHVESLRAAQPSRYVTSPQPVSEVPSLVHELLLADHLLEAGDPSLAPFVRERRAEFLTGNVYGAAHSSAFLHDVYRTVEDEGDLTPERLAETHAEYATEFREPSRATTPDGDGDARRTPGARTTATSTSSAEWRPSRRTTDSAPGTSRPTGTWSFSRPPAAATPPRRSSCWAST